MKTSFMRIFFMQYWWVIAFGLLCMMIYENGLKSRQQLYSQLTNQLRILEMEKQQAIEEQKKLESHLNSQSDPEWIELALKSGLGLVSEGEIKVFFQPDEE